MTTKNFIKVAIGVFTAGCALARPLEKSAYDFQWHKCISAYNKFMKCNKLDIGKCVSDAGGIPIFAYGSQDIESWNAPNGYALIKLGEANYAFAKKSSKRRLFPHYTVLCYFVDEWPDFS